MEKNTPRVVARVFSVFLVCAWGVARLAFVGSWFVLCVPVGVGSWVVERCAPIVAFMSRDVFIVV